VFIKPVSVEELKHRRTDNEISLIIIEKCQKFFSIKASTLSSGGKKEERI